VPCGDSGKLSSNSIHGNKGKAQGLRPAPFFLVRERIAGLVTYEQNHEQCEDQNDVCGSVHVVQQAIDFFHVYLLRAGVKPASIVRCFGQN
jgi:hypothetical protein